jgi:eukaryotic-like serine/threonine-protein kinase
VARARASTTTAFASGRYGVERVLGRGGMATVYLARDGELDRPVAVKVLSERYSGDDEFVRRFRREALTAARLAHANIVAVYDAGEEEGRLFIVMEYVEGDGLDAVREREGRLAPDRVVELALQACAALEYAHEQGVVHRDVKPANLLLRRDELLKVSDFGIARAADATQLTQAGTMLGTAAYAAPEQARGEQVGPQADLFSLGVVLYELLTGELPWRIETLASLAAVGTTPARAIRDLAPETPPEVEAAVMRCLARDARYRPATAGELAADLAGSGRERTPTVALTGPTVPLAPPADGATTVREPGRPEEGRTRARARLRPGRLAALAAAVAALAVVIGFLVSGGTDGGAGDPPPAEVEPVPRSDDPAQQARNLAEWLREHTAGSEEE